MRKILAILIALSMLTWTGLASAGLPSSLSKSVVGNSVDGQLLVNESGIPTGSTGLTYNASTKVLTATGGLVGKDVPGENAHVLFANDSTAYDCDDEGQVFNNDVGLFVENSTIGKVWACDTATKQRNVGRHLLAEQIITSAQSEVLLQALDWADTYDVVELELINFTPTLVGRLRVKLVSSATTLITSGLSHISQTWEGSNAVLIEAAATWATNLQADQLMDAGVPATCQFTIHKSVPGPKGVGWCVYTADTSESTAGVNLFVEMTNSYTDYDGFSIDMTGSNTIKGTFRLWGVSSN